MRIPLIVRGPGVPAGRDRARPGREHRLRADAGRRRQRQGRPHDGRRLAAADDPQPAQAARTASLEIEALEPLFRGNIPVNGWDRPYKGVRTDRYTYVVYKETGEQELYDRRKDPHQLDNVAARPGLRARSRRGWRRKLSEARPLQGPLLQREAVRLAVLLAVAAVALAATPARAARLGGLHDARYCEIIALQGSPPDATATVWNTIGLNTLPGRLVERVRRGRPGAASSAPRVVVLNGPRHFLMDSVTGHAGPRALLPRRSGCAGSRRSRSAPPPSSPRRRTPTARSPATTPGTGSAGAVSTSWSRPAATSTSCRATRRSATRSLTHRQAARARAAGSTCRRAGATARAGCAATSTLRRERQGDDRPGRAAEHLPAGPSRPAERPAAQAPPVEHRRRDQDGRRRDRRARSRTTAPSRGTPFGRGSVEIVVTLDGRARDRHVPAALPRRARSPARSTMPFTIEGNEIDFRGTARLTGGTGAYRGISSGALAGPRPQHPGRAERRRLADGLREVLEPDGSARRRASPRRRARAREPLVQPPPLALGLRR